MQTHSFDVVLSYLYKATYLKLGLGNIASGFRIEYLIKVT